MNEKTKDSVLWVKFEDEAARLCKLKLSDGRIGLLLAYEANSAGKEINQRAIDRGFEEVNLSSVENASCFVPADKSFPFTVRELAEALGGETLRITRQEMENNSFPRPANAVKEPEKNESKETVMTQEIENEVPEDVADEDLPIRIVISDDVADEILILLEGKDLTVDEIKPDKEEQMEIAF